MEGKNYFKQWMEISVQALVAVSAAEKWTQLTQVTLLESTN